MGDEFGGGEAVHEVLVDVEFEVGDGVADLVDFFRGVAGDQGQGGVAQGGEQQAGLQGL